MEKKKRKRITRDMGVRIHPENETIQDEIKEEIKEENETYPKLFADTVDPFYLLVRNRSEAYFIGQNPLGKRDSGDWPVSHIDTVDGAKNVRAAIIAAKAGSTEDGHGVNPEPMSDISHQVETIKVMNSLVEKWYMNKIVKKQQEDCKHENGYVTGKSNESSTCVTCGKPWN